METHDPVPVRGDDTTLPPVMINRTTMHALHMEAIERSAEKGRPVFPRAVAARVLNEWARARSAEKARQRIAARDSHHDHGEG